MFDANELIRTAVGYHQAGRLDEADAVYAKILRQNPDHFDALHLSGLVAHQRGRVIDAIDRVGRAVRLRPAEPGFRFNYGNVLAASGQDAEAVEQLRVAVALKPDFADAWTNLANALDRQKRDAELLEVRQKLVQLKPNDAEAHFKLGLLLHRLKRLAPAVTEYQAAVRLSPNLQKAQENLAVCLQSLGRTAEAVAIFDKLVPPGDAPVALSPAVHSNLMLALQYSDAVPPATVLDAHHRWARAQLPPIPGPQIRRRAMTHPIRVGYVSADFWDHPVGHFIRPMIERFDRSRFECFCYDHSEVDDRITRVLRDAATHWRTARGTTDRQLARLIEADGIDVLVDLSGHTAGHRLTAFALKPAPVQVTYLGYPGTTAVPGIDYRLTDSIADPPGMTEKWSTEKLVRLPNSFLCYTPPADAPPVSELPARKSGSITFGSFNAASKISPTTVRLWSAVLNAVPGSRLLLKAIGWNEADNRRRLVDEFAAHEIDAGRVEFLPADASWFSHMGRYGLLDLALDPFPYHGTTTTCDAIWMGVPTVTLAGATHVSRVGASVNVNAGLKDFVADDEPAFVRIAAAAAGDIDRLASLRAGLRDQVRKSILCDTAGFVAAVERAFETMANPSRD